MTTHTTTATLTDLCAQLVQAALHLGASAADAAAQSSSSLSASARHGAVEEVTKNASVAAGVRVLVEGRIGLATAAAAPQVRADIDALAARAVAAARVCTPDVHNTFAQVRARTAGVDLGLYDHATATVSPGWAVEQALLLDRLYREHQGIDGVAQAQAGVRRGEFALATADGFVGCYAYSAASLAVSGYLDDGDVKHTEGYSDAARKIGALLPAQHVAARAAMRTLARKGARKLASAKMPVIFEPAIARGFFGSVLGCLCGDAIVRGQSFLQQRMHTPIMAPGFTVTDDPTIALGWGSRPFDGEGLVSQPRVVVDVEGALQAFFLDTMTAAQLGLAGTAHASRAATGLPSPSPSNIVIAGGTGDLDSIVKRTARGLLVTRLMGRAIDPVTGDISRGAQGLLVVDGEVAHAVGEVTIAGNALSMMQGIDALGVDYDLRGAIRAPTMRFAELTVSGR